MITIPDNVQNAITGADRYLDAGDHARAVECLAVAALVDIQVNAASTLGRPAFAREIAERYAKIFAELGMEEPASRALRPGSGADRSILFVTQCLAEGNAASANLVRMVRDHAAHGWRVGVLIAEELTVREPPLAHFRCPEGRAQVVGAACLRELARHAEILQLAPRGTFLDAIELGVNAARQWNPAVAAFIASPACPIQAGLAFARIAPVQVSLSIGVPLVLRGMDHIVYNNPAKLRADAHALAGFSVSSVETSGGEALSGAHIAPAPRSAMGVPDHAVAMVTASNRLAIKLTGDFADGLLAFLVAHPACHWVGVGRGEFGEAKKRFARVADRVHFTGSVPDIRPIVRACDLYLNEFPEGGGNAVIEAMGCGVPVVAMNAGPSHGCNIGATLVGEDAIPSADAAAYWTRAAEWAADPAARMAASRRQQTRAAHRLDYTVICAEYRGIFERLLKGRAAA